MCESVLRAWRRPSREVKIIILIIHKMTNETEKVKAYAAELEGIIKDAKMGTETRMLVDYLVGKAKEKYGIV